MHMYLQDNNILLHVQMIIMQYIISYDYQVTFL